LKLLDQLVLAQRQGFPILGGRLLKLLILIGLDLDCSWFPILGGRLLKEYYKSSKKELDTFPILGGRLLKH